MSEELFRPQNIEVGSIDRSRRSRGLIITGLFELEDEASFVKLGLSVESQKLAQWRCQGDIFRS